MYLYQAIVFTQLACSLHMYRTFIYVEAVVFLVTMITFASVETYDVYTSRMRRAGIINHQSSIIVINHVTRREGTLDFFCRLY